MIEKRKVASKILKTAKDTFMGRDYKGRSSHAETIIRSHVIWSMGAGALIPVPVIDTLGVAAVQMDMIRQMCKVYDIDFKDTQYKAVVTSITSSFLARTGAKSLVKLIPVVGTYVGGAAMGVMAGASTYALGEIFKAHFESGGDLMNIDMDWMKKKFEENLEKGKEVAEDLKKKEDEKKMADVTGAEKAKHTAPNPVPEESDDILVRLKKLGELKETGVISDEEFDQMKKKLIDEF